MSNKHLVHANSNAIVDGKAKLPSDERIEYGELAVNYKKGVETIFIKNDEDEIATFSNDNTIKQQLDVKVNKDDYATDYTYGVIKLNSNENITVNTDGQLVVGGRCGQFPEGGLYFPNTVSPTKVGNYSLSISEATGLSCAHRSFILAGGTNVNLSAIAEAGATQYRVLNTQDNRFFCSAFVGGRLAVNEASAKTKTVAITSVKFANGTTIKPYYGDTESSNDIIITVSETLNPSGTLSTVRGYGKWEGSDTLSVGQGNKASTGKILQIGQAQVSNGASQNIMTGIRNYSTANSAIIVGADNINSKQYCCLFGQGHTTQNTGNGVALVGRWSEANSNTLFAVGNGTANNARSNILEIVNDNGATGIIMKSPNGTKYKLTVDNDGTLKTTAI